MLAIIDAGKWQDIIDLKSGRSISAEPQDYSSLRKLVADNPYPGDNTDASIDWVRKTSKDILDYYAPDFLLQAYTQPWFSEAYHELDDAAALMRQKRIMSDIDAVASKYGMLPVTVFCSGYLPLKGEITQPEGAQGLLESWAWGVSLAAFSQSGEGDEEIIRAMPHVASIKAKKDFFHEHPELSPSFKEFFPDYALMAEPGYAFRGYNTHNGIMYAADICEEFLPVRCTVGRPETTLQIFPLMRDALNDGKKVLLSVIEGYNADKNPEGFLPVANRDEWYCYRGLDLYMALCTGKHFYEGDIAPVYDRTKPKSQNKDYPLSGFLHGFPKTSIGDIPGKRTAVVSSRSMVTHMVAKADIAIECYNRERTKMGVLCSFKPEAIKK